MTGVDARLAAALWLVRSAGGQQPRRTLDARTWPYSWSPDGNAVAIYTVDETTARDILVAYRNGEGGWQIADFLVTSANERSPSGWSRPPAAGSPRGRATAASCVLTNTDAAVSRLSR